MTAPSAAARLTRIICTIGPASSDVAVLRRLIAAGMDVARLNFSHGEQPVHARVIENIRTAAAETGSHVAILQDLQGPKIRTRTVQGGEVVLVDGAPFTITTRDIGAGDARIVGTGYESLPTDVTPGNTILLDDGYLALTVESVDGTEIHTRVAKGGVLRDRKGIIVPGVSISAPAISEKDIEDLRFGLTQGVDAIALSFVRSERDVQELRSMMGVMGRVVPIIAKIERYEGISDIEDIVREADGIMVARGDLGVEMPTEEVPVLQKHIIRRCNFHGKPVITATQMLESMIHNPRPTRAEASDVANAVLDGTDCVMLSGETSVGAYPVETVETMDRIVRAIEREAAHQRAVLYAADAATIHGTSTEHTSGVPDAVGHAACVVAEQIGASAIVTLTTSGRTARLIAKYRPSTPILALTDDEETARRLSFVWGVRAVHIPPLAQYDYCIDGMADHVLASGFVRPGDLVVYSAGSPLHQRNATNMLEVRTL
jgi:pyruvate kinase